MRPVERIEIVDYVTYEEGREGYRKRVLAEKAPRRIHVGPHLTFLFETRETIRYQVQEMIRAERIVREADILHELATYNELLGGPGELGATLLIELADEAAREGRLTAWLDLPRHLYVKLEDRSLVRARFDPRQVGDTRLSSVQYLKFPTGGRVPVAVGCDHADPELHRETALTPEQRSAFARDLAG
jgi:hypothetical protein